MMVVNMEEHKQYNLEAHNELPVQQQTYGQSPTIYREDRDLNIKDFYVFNNQESINKKGQKFNRTPFSTLSGSVYSVAVQDFLIGITNLSYAASIGLPRPKLVGPGKTYIVKDEAGGATTTTITIRSAGEETIDGASTATITTNYASKSFYSDGNVWYIY
jgi:hypothetical protein